MLRSRWRAVCVSASSARTRPFARSDASAIARCENSSACTMPASSAAFRTRHASDARSCASGSWGSGGRALRLVASSSSSSLFFSVAAWRILASCIASAAEPSLWPAASMPVSSACSAASASAAMASISDAWFAAVCFSSSTQWSSTLIFSASVTIETSMPACGAGSSTVTRLTGLADSFRSTARPCGVCRSTQPLRLVPLCRVHTRSRSPADGAG